MCSAVLCTSIAEELFIISRLSRSAERDKRIFTGGVVTGNGSCSAAFCESAALRGIPPQSLLRKASSPKGAPLGTAGNFAATAEAVPLGKVASPQAMTEGVASGAVKFPVHPQSLRFRQRLSLWESWQALSGLTERARTLA